MCPHWSDRELHTRGSYMTYEEGGSMTGYDLSLSFKEIEPVYRDDQEKSLGMGF